MKVSYHELHNKVINIKESAWGVKFDSILTIVDRLTKYTMFISFKKPQQHQYWCTSYCKNWLTITAIKEFIINRDKLFTSKFWETLTAELRINHKMLTTYHSQMNEQSKQMNQTVEMYLRHYVNKIRTTEYNCCQQHSLCTITHKMKPQKKHHFEQIMNITWRYDKNCKHTDHKTRKQY
jgi:hypothetical protein